MVLKVITAAIFVATFASSGLSKELLPEKCPTYWTAFGDHCYRFFGQRVNLREAQYNCRIHGSGGGFGYLASIHSQEENDFIGTIFKSSTPAESVNWHLWIGLNDEREEGNFVWSDGSDVNFTLWAPGQPEGGRSQ
ncbi:Alpha-N-acetylgalactosamine-specific lectin [Holothuria leucospilota]|uniref:Alpha-N-acetylgalactosamine-specific lectin n=1 Tax=Holothuria leucospilota TaxID=206669 RepID=A0A9Q1H7J4_HOLLE|nr:Alpha-N-acetylgalactosamine-specific lectin [Holothuria leucospilota]